MAKSAKSAVLPTSHVFSTVTGNSNLHVFLEKCKKGAGAISDPGNLNPKKDKRVEGRVEDFQKKSQLEKWIVLWAHLSYFQHKSVSLLMSRKELVGNLEQSRDRDGEQTLLSRCSRAPCVKLTHNANALLCHPLGHARSDQHSLSALYFKCLSVLSASHAFRDLHPIHQTQPIPGTAR